MPFRLKGLGPTSPFLVNALACVYGVAIEMFKLPFMQFYPSDWISDTRVLSLAARGAWMDLICAMWIAPERGKLDWSMIQFQNFLGVKQSEANSLWHELTSSGVADMKADTKAHRVTVMSRRMLREEHQRNQARLRQSRKRHAVNSDSSRLIYQKSEVRSHIKNKIPPSPDAVKSSQLLSDMIFENNPNRTAPTKSILMA